MSDFVSLTELEDKTRRMADVQNNLLRHPQSEVWDNINRGIKQFNAEVVKCNGQGLFETDTFVTTTPGIEMYGLPAQLLQVTKVWTNISGRERILYGYEAKETDGMRDNLPLGSEWGDLPFWRIVGDNVSLRPTYNSPLTVYIRYIATAVKLTAGSDTLDAIEGFDEFIVAYAARRCAFKDNKVDLIGLCSQDMAETIARMQATVRARNAASPRRMTDTRGSSMGRHYGRSWKGYWWR